MSAPPRLLFHVQHLLGVGHLNRARLIARACVEAGLTVEMTVNEDPDGTAVEAVPEGVAALPLPAIHAADASFSALVDGAGRPVDAAHWAARARRLETAIAERPPAVLLIEGYPFARRRLRGEIEPLAAQARKAGAAVVCSLRDILVAKTDPARNAETLARAEALHDRILVHGDADFAPLSASFPSADALAGRIITTGYVAPAEVPPPWHGDRPDAPILVSVGGGAVGEALLEAAVEAAIQARTTGGATPAVAGRPWRLLGGPKLPDVARARLTARLANRTGIALEPALDGPAFRRALAGAALSISQAGYNTAVDLWRAGPPAVLIPFAGPDGKESEQPMRARLMAERGEALVLPEDALTPQRLVETVEMALAGVRSGPRDRLPPPSLDGARESARHLAALAGVRGLG